MAKLHAQNLSARLLFEGRLMHGMFRLINQLLIFWLMVAALKLSGEPSVKRGIYINLAEAFGFDGLRDVRSRDAFIEMLPQISKTSKSYFVLSTRYWDAGDQGNVELLGKLQSFSAPRLLSGTELAMYSPEVSFTSWVRVLDDFRGGYLVRKVFSVDTAEYSCWGWYLDRIAGQQLHFGMHDSFETEDDSKHQVHVGHVASADPFPSNAYLMLTVVVMQQKAIFYQNLERVGEAVLPRPVTDCSGHSSGGILVGSASMEMGGTRFFPKALTYEDIKELLLYGSQLSDMSTGSEPFRTGEDEAAGTAAELALVQRSLESKLQNLESQITDRQDKLEVSLVTKAVLEQSVQTAAAVAWPPAGIMPLGDTRSESWRPENASHVATQDAANRSFYQLLTGPVRLSRTSDHDARLFFADMSTDLRRCHAAFLGRQVDTSRVCLASCSIQS